MHKIVIKKAFTGVQYHNDCPYCGLNTNLLPEEEKVIVDNVKYCKCCYDGKSNKKKVVPGDYYTFSLSSAKPNW